MLNVTVTNLGVSAADTLTLGHCARGFICDEVYTSAVTGELVLTGCRHLDGGTLKLDKGTNIISVRPVPAN